MRYSKPPVRAELLVLAVTEVEEHAQAATRADGRGPRSPGGARRARPGYV